MWWWSAVIVPAVLAWPIQEPMSNRTKRGAGGQCYSHIITFGKETQTTNGWFDGTYASYTCRTDSSTYIIAGYQFPDFSDTRECIGSSWAPRIPPAHSDPQCTDICNKWAYKDANSQAPVGTQGSGISYDVCRERGGCHTDEGACVTTKYPAMVRLTGKAPAKVLASQDYAAPRQCAWRCYYGDVREGDPLNPPANCGVLGVKTMKYVPELKKNLYTCQMGGASGALSDAPGSDTFVTVSIEAAPKYEAEVNTLAQGSHFGCYKDAALQQSRFVAMDIGGVLTIDRCLETCQIQGYNLAALKGGKECHCSMEPNEGLWDPSTCDVSCTGDSAATCGGSAAADIYMVSQVPEYRGCFKGVTSTRQWDASNTKSLGVCIADCGRQGFPFAVVTKGGNCDCAKGTGTVTTLEDCVTTCVYDGQPGMCGGDSAASIYVTNTAYNYGKDQVTTMAKVMYSDQAMNGFTASLFRNLPALRTFISQKLIVHSYEPVIAKHEMSTDPAEEIKGCGDLLEVKSQSNGDVMIRATYLKSSDLSEHLKDLSPKRVSIYAVTFDIDADIDAPYALLVFARRVVMDKNFVFHVSTWSNVPDLAVDLEVIKTKGVPVDATAMRRLFTCARILIEEKTPMSQCASWSILRALTAAPSLDSAQTSQAGQVRSYIASLRGIDRLNMHVVPLYSTIRISSILNTIYDSITVYNDKYERLKANIQSYHDLQTYGKALTDIYTEQQILDDQAALLESVEVIRGAESVYAALKQEFEYARDKQHEASKVFQKSLEKAEQVAIIKQIISLIQSVTKAFNGIATGNYKDAIAPAIEAVKGARGLGNSLNGVTDMIRGMDEMVWKMEKHMKKIEEVQVYPYEGQEFSYNIDNVVAMRVQLVAWDNLKTQMDAILGESSMRAFGGATEYARSILDVCNWGRAMSEAMIEQAEAMRDAISKRSALDSRKEVKDKTDTALQGLKKDLSNRQDLLDVIEEQSFEVREDLNDALIMFCQAYFFERLQECRESYRPSYAGSLSDLLLKINGAKRDSLLISNVPSTTAREVIITDTNTDPQCRDTTLCPVNCLRTMRQFTYYIDTNNKHFSDLNQYRISSLEIEAIGAKGSGYDVFLKFVIQVSGTFQGRANGNIYSFFMRPLKKNFEYNIDSGEVMMQADVYAPLEKVVNQVTPFASWRIKIADTDRNKAIDLSGVKTIRITMRGSSMFNGRKRSLRDLLGLE